VLLHACAGHGRFETKYLSHLKVSNSLRGLLDPEDGNQIQTHNTEHPRRAKASTPPWPKPENSHNLQIFNYIFKFGNISYSSSSSSSLGMKATALLVSKLTNISAFDISEVSLTSIPTSFCTSRRRFCTIRLNLPFAVFAPSFQAKRKISFHICTTRRYQ
jgi:hypothetical protein